MVALPAFCIGLWNDESFSKIDDSSSVCMGCEVGLFVSLVHNVDFTAVLCCRPFEDADLLILKQYFL